jgi:hypothetical protein
MKTGASFHSVLKQIQELSDAFSLLKRDSRVSAYPATTWERESFQ